MTSEERVIRFGVSWESHEAARPEAMKAVRGLLGPNGFVRLYVHLDEIFADAESNFAHRMDDALSVQPAWWKLDADMRAITEAGLAIYVQFIWCPAWASEGKPAYVSYTRGCSAFKNPMSATDGLRFAEEHDYCVNPPHIDPKAFEWMCRQIAIRIGEHVSWWSDWNEDGIDIYWPAIRLANTGQIARADAIRRRINEVALPARRGVRSVIPDASFTMSDAAEIGTFHEHLLQRVGFQPFGLDHLELPHDYDASALSFHGYPWGDFENLKRRISEFVAVSERCVICDGPPRNGLHSEIGAAQRPDSHTYAPLSLGNTLMLTEMGDEGSGRLVEAIEWSLANHPEITAYSAHDAAQFFADWGKTYTLNTKGERFKQVIASVTPQQPTLPDVPPMPAKPCENCAALRDENRSLSRKLEVAEGQIRIMRELVQKASDLLGMVLAE